MDFVDPLPPRNGHCFLALHLKSLALSLVNENSLWSLPSRGCAYWGTASGQLNRQAFRKSLSTRCANFQRSLSQSIRGMCHLNLCSFQWRTWIFETIFENELPESYKCYNFFFFFTLIWRVQHWLSHNQWLLTILVWVTIEIKLTILERKKFSFRESSYPKQLSYWKTKLTKYNVV